MRGSQCFWDLGECSWLRHVCVPKAPGLPSCHSSFQPSKQLSSLKSWRRLSRVPRKGVQHLKNFHIPDNHGAIPGSCRQQLEIRTECHLCAACHDTQRGERGCSCCHREKRDIFELVYVLYFPSWNSRSCLNPVVCARSKIRFLQTYLGQCVLLLS